MKVNTTKETIFESLEMFFLYCSGLLRGQINIEGIKCAMPQHEEDFLLETFSDKHKEDSNDSSTFNVMPSESDCSPEHL